MIRRVLLEVLMATEYNEVFSVHHSKTADRCEDSIPLDISLQASPIIMPTLSSIDEHLSLNTRVFRMIYDGITIISIEEILLPSAQNGSLDVPVYS
jgi:hypothetical protein